MRDRILEVLNRCDKALTIYEVSEELGVSSVSDIEALCDELRKLEEESLIYHTNKDKYMLLANSHLRRGVIRVNKKGFGFVSLSSGEDDIYIDVSNMNGAIHNDIVIVEIISKKNLSRVEGRVLKVVKRQIEDYIGEITIDDKGRGIIKLDDNKVKIEIMIPKEDTLNAVDGHKVIVNLVKKVTHTKYIGIVKEIIGHKDDPGVDILSIIYKYGINTVFSDEVVDELRKIPNNVLEEDKIGRRDLTNEVIFTIDGADTKDIDDAISLKILSNGNYQLGVHIADVSYYVREGSAIDNEAMDRGTSVYLVDRVIPMIPHELSNGICSLNEGVERLAISCVMEFNNKGKQVNYEIFPSVIKSNKKMTYSNVNRIIENQENVSGYEEYFDTLLKMKELAHILRKAKEDRGYLDFDVDEAKIIVNDKGMAIDVVKRERGEGEKLIEDFMIAANECVASHIYYMSLPFIYRVHEYPKEEKLREFLEFVSSLGYNLLGDLKDNHPKTLQRILNELKTKKESKILSTLMLRCMQKAVYKPVNLGHYALGSKCYTHFTSPIRRYPDTTVHRLLRTYLFENKLDNNTLSHWEDKLVYIAEHSSLKERSSIDCERDVDDMKMAEYMESHIGEEFVGMVSSVTNFGMFVELDNLIEGLVPLRDMPDFFHFDERTLSLTGEKSHVKYTIGDIVKVKVVRASRIDATIDFEVVQNISNPSKSNISKKKLDNRRNNRDNYKKNMRKKFYRGKTDKKR